MGRVRTVSLDDIQPTERGFVERSLTYCLWHLTQETDALLPIAVRETAQGLAILDGRHRALAHALAEEEHADVFVADSFRDQYSTKTRPDVPLRGVADANECINRNWERAARRARLFYERGITSVYDAIRENPNLKSSSYVQGLLARAQKPTPPKPPKSTRDIQEAIGK